MHRKWTAVLLTTALTGGIAATAGVAGGTATALPAPPAHTLVRPAVAVPDPTKTLDVLGLLGSVLKAVGALVSSVAPVPVPTAGAPVDADALQDKLTLLDAASSKLKQALPAATVPALPVTPAVPGLPVPVPADAGNDVGAGAGARADHVGLPLPVGSVEDQLTALTKDAAELVAAATAKKPDAGAVKAALTSLSADSLGVSTATVTRLTGA